MNMEKDKKTVDESMKSASQEKTNKNNDSAKTEKADKNGGHEKGSDKEPDNVSCADDKNKNENDTCDKKSEENKEPLKEALKQVEELKDKYLRSVAEFDNYRKRTLKEKTELILNGSEKAVQAMLPVIDDMERAIENAEKTEDVKVLKDGMNLIYQKLNKVLQGLGVRKIETKDADFDTDYHEAVAMVPGMGDDKKGKILDCVQAGYTLNDKVIRHAKVAVGQ